MTDDGVLLEITGAIKKFAAVTALKNVDLELRKNEILALLGDNGAGKSTLIRCLSGVHRLDEGQMLLDGEPIAPRTPTEAQALGISTVYQDLALFDNMSAANNFYAGREQSKPRWLGRFGFVRQRAMNESARNALRRLEVNIPDVRAPVALMSGGQRQAIAVARAEAFAKRIIILDEPTAALGVRESRSVHRSISRLRERGLSVIIISHNLEEVIALADRAIVLRQGRNVGEAPAIPDNQELLVSMIVGGSSRGVETG
jgi:ribose transport system ATP-binding protein